MRHSITILFILTLTFFSSESFSQPDCILGYKYIGTIQSDSLVVDSIEVPSIQYLMGWDKKDVEYMESIIAVVTNGKVEVACVSPLGQVFCKSVDRIINDVFMGKLNLRKEDKLIYTIKLHLKESEKILEIGIPVEKIKFEKIDNNGPLKIIIDIGIIKL